MLDLPRDPRILRLLEAGPRATPFIDLPGGTILMGSTLRADEQPVHEVEVGPFSVALTPVTNAEYAACLAATGHEPPGEWENLRFTAPDCPVVSVSWFDAIDYCAWLSELVGRACRLPTEAEREYAARGGVPDVLYPWGNEPWDRGVHGRGAQGADRPHPVGTSEANGFGLFHMGDNVHEWCSDWYDPEEYARRALAAPVRDPRGPEDERPRRASRGGSWRHHVKVARIAARSSLGPERRYNDYGMRVYADPA
ncbi:MAG: SUMF1/EgtB/PvdO family nonheme iron enzyme [Chloroflexi bacterium]|nr:SUMF1/EgtB/PvdO family nonheme iron enzyme [Chloroflexota bacterium]MQC25533.1 hypothetical protein [Chloroflexota bacterium]